MNTMARIATAATVLGLGSAAHAFPKPPPAASTPRQTTVLAATPAPETRIVFASNRNGGQMDLFTIDSDGRNLTAVTNTPGDELTPDWSPSRKSIVFERGNALWTIDNNGRSEKQIATLKLAGAHPRFSPDGGSIAYSDDGGNNRDIFVVPVDGGKPVNVTRHLQDDDLPLWSPDGTRILFVRAKNQSWVMNRDGEGALAVFPHYAFWNCEGLIQGTPLVTNDDGRFHFYTTAGRVGPAEASAALGTVPRDLEGVTLDPNKSCTRFVIARGDSVSSLLATVDPKGQVEPVTFNNVPGVRDITPSW